MKQTIYGVLLYVFLILPPVAKLLESIMIMHMHMQMPLIIVAGFLMARFFQTRFPGFFEKWNQNGVPGIILFIMVSSYWMVIPRAMDEAIAIPWVEHFKFFSLAFLAGVPLRDSWKKLSSGGKNIVYVFFTVFFLLTGWLYISYESQLCNSYPIVEQKTLGWGSLTVAACLLIYLIQQVFFDQSEFE